MRDQNRFHFCRAETFARNFNRVIASTENVPKSIVIDCRPVSVHPSVRPTRPVTIDVTLRVSPKSARHSDPRFANDQFADFAADGFPIFIYYIRRHAGQRTGKSARFHWREDVAHDDATGDFRATGIINDREFSATDVLEQPHPWIGIPWFAGGSEFAQR